MFGTGHIDVEGFAGTVWHDGWYLWFALPNSCVASANGATNAGTRHMYSMGRINLLPASFARTSEKTGLLVYFVRVRESGYNPLLHTVVPILAIVAMVPALLAAIGIGSGIFSFISPLPSPYNIAARITVGWLVLGVLSAVWIWTAHPERARATEHIFIDDPQPEAVPEGAVAATV